MKKLKMVNAYAIQLIAIKTATNAKRFKELAEKAGSVEVTMDFPFVYVMYLTDEERMKAYEEFSKVFDYCKVVENVATVPDPKQD